KSGTVMAEIEVSIEPGTIVAAIPDASRERLGLKTGDRVTVFIKATDVLLGKCLLRHAADESALAPSSGVAGYSPDFAGSPPPASPGTPPTSRDPPPPASPGTPPTSRDPPPPASPGTPPTSRGRDKCYSGDPACLRRPRNIR